MKLLTRKEIIELWQKQGENYLNQLCCPNCRDILIKEYGKYSCENMLCGINEVENG